MTSILTLTAVSAMFLNLPLQLGIGAREIYFERERPLIYSLFSAALLFVSLVFEWLLFAYVFSPLSLGFLKYIILLPLGAVFPSCLGFFLGKFVRKFSAKDIAALNLSNASGANIAALFITLSLAASAAEALALAAGFSAGLFLANAVLRSIRFRIEREKVSVFLRGVPLMFIAMGILSLAVMAAASIILH
ncbi:MAG: hypothetical protein LBC77_02640 [Spirochaetaceae bacterium]|jgi:electron transport complex protein RnfA|nr:hypothetical protein [Spirochaetaceae bacterium]